MVFPFDEYAAIEYEFNSDPDLMSIIKDIKNNNGTNLEVTWLEGNKDCVYVDLDGWYVGHSKERYSTFEDMSMRYSPIFKDKWYSVIFNKLRKVEKKEAEGLGDV